MTMNVQLFAILPFSGGKFSDIGIPIAKRMNRSGEGPTLNAKLRIGRVDSSYSFSSSSAWIILLPLLLLLLRESADQLTRSPIQDFHVTWKYFVITYIRYYAPLSLLLLLLSFNILRSGSRQKYSHSSRAEQSLRIVFATVSASIPFNIIFHFHKTTRAKPLLQLSRKVG